MNTENANDTSSDSSPRPTTLGVDDARAKANHISSQIRDMIGIENGQVTQSGAGLSPCDKDPDHLCLLRHPWSIYKVTPDELKAGFQRLRETADSETEPLILVHVVSGCCRAPEGTDLTKEY